MNIISVSVALLFLCRNSDAVWCQSCSSFRSECSSFEKCEGRYCLFEQIINAQGLLSIHRRCHDQPFYKFDDNYISQVLDQCVTRTTVFGTYCVKICSSYDNCNSDCNTYIPSPIVPQITCFECENFNGMECQTNICRGRYCFYERNFDGKSVTTRKGCVNELPYQTENGFKPKHDVCEVISTDSSQSLVKVCDNQDFCNSDCVPNNPTNSIQRDPTVTCYCNGKGCVSDSCQGKFCTFLRQIGKGDIKTEITKGCSEDGAVIYPDESQSFTINSCEYRTINDIHYEALVCNRNKCNTGCPSLVTCECDPKDQPNCQQGLCQGLFCLYNSVKTPKNLSVAKSCVSFESLTVPNTDSYSASGTCQKWTIDNVIYSYKLCRSDLCNKSCGSEIVTTTTPRTKVASATLSGALLLLLLPIMPYFMKS